MQTISSWNETSQDALSVLGGIEDLDQAVACGAVYYLWAKDHGGIRSEVAQREVTTLASSPQACYTRYPSSATCFMRRSTRDGRRHRVRNWKQRSWLENRKRARRFRFFSSTTRTSDKPGQLLKDWDESELTETPPMETELAATDSPGLVPVKFESRVTELGILELFCKSSRTNESWKLELQVRSAD